MSVGAGHWERGSVASPQPIECDPEHAGHAPERIHRGTDATAFVPPYSFLRRTNFERESGHRETGCLARESETRPDRVLRFHPNESV